VVARHPPRGGREGPRDMRHSRAMPKGTQLLRDLVRRICPFEFPFVLRRQKFDSTDKALSDCREGSRSCTIFAAVCADGTERYESR
jgi:hypothetical protein